MNLLCERWTAWISSPDLTVIITDGLDRVGDPTAVGDLGFGDPTSVFSFDLSFASSLESCVCGVLRIS